MLQQSNWKALAIAGCKKLIKRVTAKEQKLKAQEKIAMKFDGGHWCLFEGTPEENDKGIAEQLALPAKRIIEGIIPYKDEYLMQFIFEEGFDAETRFDSIWKVVTEGFKQLRIDAGGWPRDNSITFRLRRMK